MENRTNAPAGTSGSGAPEPPWRLRARGQAPRIPLTRQAIIEAALRVLDREGMDALSMRRVGEELGTGAASLYWHVRNKEELLHLLFERVTEEIVLPEPDPSRWQQQLRDLARQMRAVMNRHRDIARISLGRVPAGPTIALLTEWLFDLLRPAGIPDRVIALLGDLFGLYVGAYCFEESLPFGAPTGEDLPPDQIVEMFKDYVRSLPEDRFPNTRSAVDLLFSGDRDERFEFGVDVMLRGLATYASAG
ncbi:MAG TPA: TetR/AcrR family transcriptional regulator C-terminal domain-containing protein [Actinomycetes bacterium]|jgi:AcrR family transcriptional regulator|nr:TetR/AcrR family transcriptional regulator C-terminal domain-containing protein [Actinomycetes bacterium]